MNSKQKQWVRAAGVRAIKTFFQTMVGTIGGTTLINEVNWAIVFSASTLAMVMSVATSIAGLPEINDMGE